MTFQTVVLKIRRAVLCGTRRERQPPTETVRLEIGSPTDVRRVDVSATLPGLTDAERRYIRKKASSDAIHLLGLQSEPPSHPATSPPSPTRSSSPSLAHTSATSSREPSVALLNAASKDLPTALPTPPRRIHNENSPPASRMRTMWQGANRLSNGSTCHEGLYEKLEQIKGAEVQEKGLTDFFMTLNMEFDFEDKRSVRASSLHASESTRTLSLTEGFEMQDAKGGRFQPTAKNLVIQMATDATNFEDSSDDSDFEGDSLMAAEHAQLVKI